MCIVRKCLPFYLVLKLIAKTQVNQLLYVCYVFSTEIRNGKRFVMIENISLFLLLKEFR